MNDNLVSSEIINKVMHLVLNDEKNQNTLSEKMISDLDNKINEASQNNSIKVIIISATGKVDIYICNRVRVSSMARLWS